LTVASNSAAKRLSARDSDLSTFASKLGVGHLLEGTVRRANDRIRITAKLIEAKTGKQLWAERFDRESTDIFAIQDEITNQVVSQLSKIFKQKTLKKKSRGYVPNSLAYDYYIKGRAQRIPPTPGNLKAAFANFNKAIEIDPKFAGGYAGASLATILAASDSTNTPDSAKSGLKKALELAKKSVELDPEFGPGWGSLAEVFLRTGQYQKCLEAIKKAILAAPNDSLMRAHYGRYLGYVGRADEGIEQVKQAMRMSPDSLPLLYFLGANQRVIGQYDEAIESLTEHRNRLGGRILPAPKVQLIASYVQSGQLGKAKEETAKFLKAAPNFTAAKANKIHQYQNPEDQQNFSEALLEAGLGN
jgi:adenylate cyclase